MSQTVCVVVDDTDQKQLALIAMDRNRPQKHIQRARIVLLSGEGLAVAEVARQAGVSRPAVWRWQVVSVVWRPPTAWSARMEHCPCWCEISVRLTSYSPVDKYDDISLVRWISC